MTTPLHVRVKEALKEISGINIINEWMANNVTDMDDTYEHLTELLVDITTKTQGFWFWKKRVPVLTMPELKNRLNAKLSKKPYFTSTGRIEYALESDSPAGCGGYFAELVVITEKPVYNPN